ncbi:hypothetical protein PYW08_001282 [Mythimna loreyi]|uniref:Uncharacterized protein n=1 Tax=Mythimna loreyi TaxID=667449 RepID=A0ACC2R566_9NEOP|nr:hypothetical protein PYW08_001282 [Mythimna loreyi]
MAASALPFTPTPNTCTCPKLYLLPTYPYHEDIGMVEAINVNLCNSTPVDTSKKPILWMLGGLGSVKGVQCDKIIPKTQTGPSTGSPNRAEVKGRSKEATSYTEQGGMVSNDVCLNLLRKQAKAANTKGSPGDGHLRDKDQAATFGKIAKVPINTDKTPIVWILGGPGSGKGTQSAKVVDKYGYTHLSTGDLLRAEMDKGGEMAKTLSTIINRGELVPTEHVLSLLKSEMHAKVTAGTKGFLVDGYPREKAQGIAFEKDVAPATAILYFEATDDTLVKRMRYRGATTGRSDDNEFAIQQRLKSHHETKQALLDEYPSKITKIDAEFSVDAVFADVEKALLPIIARTT